jgi:hypothetical protein
MPSKSTANSMMEATVRVPEHVVRRDFAAETVVLNLNTGKYHGLNPTAGRMLATLEEVGSVSEAAARISAEFERPLADVERDISEFCASLLERELIEISGENAA